MPRAHFGGDSATRVAQEVAIIKSALNFDKSMCVCGCVCVDTHTPPPHPPTNTQHDRSCRYQECQSASNTDTAITV